MKKLIYFASEAAEDLPEARLALGFGFTPEGGWREGERGEAAGLVLDDRYPPSEAGLAAAERALGDWAGCILCDFERPPEPGLIRLLRRWEGREVIVPEAWAAFPHRAVLLRPYAPGLGFRRWLERGQARYGAVVLDAAPIRCRIRPGQPAETDPMSQEENGAEPGQPPSEGEGWDCAGALCRCRWENGELYFWDTRRTLIRRCRAAAVPAVILLREWLRLPLEVPDAEA